MSGFSSPSPLADMNLSSSQSSKEDRRTEKILAQVEECEWIHKNDRFPVLEKLIHAIGVPDMFCEEEHGVAIWMNRTYEGIPFSRIELTDDQVKQTYLNSTTNGFLYMTIDYNIAKSSCKEKAMNLTPHVIIDIEGAKVKARGDSIEMCIAILSIFTRVGNSKATPEMAKEINAADKAVLLVKKGQKDTLSKVIATLRENLQAK